MNRHVLSRFFAASALSIAVLSPVAGSPGAPRAQMFGKRDETNHVREIAKAKVPILLVSSGPLAQPAAQQIETLLKRSPDWGGRKDDDCRVVSIEDARGLLKGRGAATFTTIFLVASLDLRKSPLPDDIARLLPFDAEATRSYRSVAKSVCLRPVAGKLQFNIGFCAPDTARLTKLVDSFTRKTSNNFRTLGYDESHESRHIAIFRNPDHTALIDGNWGRAVGPGVWQDIRVASLNERGKWNDADLEEFFEVYFLDRSRQDAVPADVSSLLDGVELTETTVAVLQDDKPHQRKRFVVSAPNATILQSRLQRYGDPSALAGAPKTEQLLDLRGLGSTALVVVRNESVTSEIASRVHPMISDELRRTLGVDVKLGDRATAALTDRMTVESFLGATDTGRKLRQSLGSRFVWVYTISQLGGSVSYSAEQAKTTPEPPAFTALRPDEPSRGKKETASDWNARYQSWQNDVVRYNESRQRHLTATEGVSVNWRQWIVARVQANARGILQLVDTEGRDGAKPIWSVECNASPTFQDEIKTQEAVVRGHFARPNPLVAPENQNRCSVDRLVEAAGSAVDAALLTLRSGALLDPPGTVTRKPPVEEKRQPAPVATTLVIADIDGFVVTINAGKRQGIRVGDKIAVPLKTREITDPVSGKVISSKILEVAMLRVTSVDAEACECAPITADDKARIAKLARGLPVRHIRAGG